MANVERRQMNREAGDMKHIERGNIDLKPRQFVVAMYYLKIGDVAFNVNKPVLRRRREAMRA